jgi:hypothetical protein
VDANRYRELARREAELAEAELERSRSAWRYALSQESGGLRDHFLRMAAQSRAESLQHQHMAEHFESRAVRARETTPDLATGRR